MSGAPQHPGKLAGSKWSNVDPAVPVRHFVVTEVRADGTVVLASVLEPDRVLQLPWRGLRERSTWQPGWV